MRIHGQTVVLTRESVGWTDVAACRCLNLTDNNDMRGCEG